MARSGILLEHVRSAVGQSRDARLHDGVQHGNVPVRVQPQPLLYIHLSKWIKRKEGHFERNFRLCHYLVLMEKLLAGYIVEYKEHRELARKIAVAACPVSKMLSNTANIAYWLY